MVRFDQDGIVFEDEDNIDQYEAKLLSTGELKIEYLPSGDVWTFNTDGSLDLSSISASAVDHDATSNRTHTGDDLTPDSLDVASSFVDASGTSHTGELADISDTSIGFPYDINSVQDVPDGNSVFIEGPVNAIGGTLDDRNSRVKIE